MSKPQVYQGQSKAEVASRWESFIVRTQERIFSKLLKYSVGRGRALELDSISRLDITGGHRFLRDVGQADKTERQKLSKRSRMQNVETLRRMYKGENDWGNQHVGNITDVNSSMQFSQGLKIAHSEKWKMQHSDTQGKPPDPPELEVWKDFLEFNDLQDEGGIDIGNSGELDGQVLWTWEKDETARNVRMWTVPLLETKYKVEYEKVWQPSQAVLNPGDDDEEILTADEFIFIKLRSISNGRYGIPTCARVITDIVSLDQAVSDWRKINKLFASPTPIFKASGGENGIDRIWDEIKAINWRIGKAFVVADEDTFELVTLDPQAVETLYKEIIMLLQMVSGSTSVPVHFLGHPELMSNRAVAKEDFKPTIIHAGRAQKRYTGGLDKLKEKVLPVLSELHGQEYEHTNITHTFPAPAADIEGLVAAWLPARIAKQISHETFLTKVGVDDPDGEMQRIADEMGDGGLPQDDREGDEAEDRLKVITQQAQDELEQEGTAA